MKLDLSSENKDGIRIEHSFEDLHDPQFDKYFVSLFADDPKIGRTFRGNGTIVGPYLITAAHVAQSEDKTISFQKMFFRFDGELKEVCNEDIVHDGRGYDKESQIHDDLIIYKLQGIESELRLNDEPITKFMEFDTIMFGRINASWESPLKSICKVFSLVGFDNEIIRPFGNNNIPLWWNCYAVFNPDSFSCGNSGASLFVEGIVYGILCTANQYGQGPIGNIIDARYINEFIEKNNE